MDENQLAIYLMKMGKMEPLPASLLANRVFVEYPENVKKAFISYCKGEFLDVSVEQFSASEIMNLCICNPIAAYELLNLLHKNPQEGKRVLTFNICTK